MKKSQLNKISKYYQEKDRKEKKELIEKLKKSLSSMGVVIPEDCVRQQNTIKRLTKLLLNAQYGKILY